jgi:hypothetical protein
LKITFKTEKKNTQKAKIENVADSVRLGLIESVYGSSNGQATIHASWSLKDLQLLQHVENVLELRYSIGSINS